MFINNDFKKSSLGKIFNAFKSNYIERMSKQFYINVKHDAKNPTIYKKVRNYYK